jgi:hypothetical protein
MPEETKFNTIHIIPAAYIVKDPVYLVPDFGDIIIDLRPAVKSVGESVSPFSHQVFGVVSFQLTE